MSKESETEVCLDCAPACDLPQPSTSTSTPTALPPASTEKALKDGILVAAESTEEHAKKQDEVEDVMKPETFLPPSMKVGPSVYIEYCDRVSQPARTGTGNI